MDIKLCFLAIISLGQIYEGGAIECYECISYRITGITGYDDLRDQDCEDGSDIDNKRSGCRSCGKLDYDISVQYTDQLGDRQTVTQEVVFRGCLVEEEEEECIDLRTYENKYGSEREFELELENEFEMNIGVSNAEVTSWGGNACICNDDLCNSAALATASITMVFLAIATLLAQ